MDLDTPRDPAAMHDGDSLIMDSPEPHDASNRRLRHGRSPKTRSLSDGGGTPSKLSPSPLIIEAARRTSKDDSGLHSFASPVTPSRPSAAMTGRSGLALQMSRKEEEEGTPPPPPASGSARGRAGSSGSMMRPGGGSSSNGAPPPGVPLSPKVDHAHIYASHAHSPTNVLPRRSRGLDFSRAATSLHHSTLAEHSSPDSSPTMGGRAVHMNMNIPSSSAAARDWGRLGPEQSSSSLWSIMGSQERMNLSGSAGSASNTLAVDSSSSDEDADLDEDMDDDAIMTTPQMNRTGMGMPPIGAPFGSPAMGSLLSFQQRQRQRKGGRKRGQTAAAAAGRGPWASSIAKSPPQGGGGGGGAAAARRESISWQANQLRISGAESDEGQRAGEGGMTIRKVAGRRANLLPKTKNFARIRAALMEEGAPADTDVRHEAEVIKQVRDSDAPPAATTQQQSQPQPHQGQGQLDSAASSPNLNHDVPLDDHGMGGGGGGGGDAGGLVRAADNDDDMMGDLTAGLSSSFKQTAMRNAKGRTFWDTFPESSGRMTPPPVVGGGGGAAGEKGLGRGSSSGMSEDWGMDSPVTGGPNGMAQPPSAAEITRRINNKRRRDDDLDPVSFKRRAVSPGLNSVHGSPVTQSPMQREAGAVSSWGASRPGSNGRDGGQVSDGGGGGRSSSSTRGERGSGSSTSGGKGRVGFQGMVDTNDGIMRMSIE